MADKENCTRVTRPPKKRAVEAMSPPNEAHKQTTPTRKKRVILGDISSNVLSNLNANLRNEPHKAEKRPAAMKGKQSVTAVPAAPAKTPVEDVVNLPASNRKEIDTTKTENDPQMCTQYANGIYEYLREMESEAKRRPFPDYIGNVQREISANMRGMLVDWLAEVAEEYKLEPDTLYSAVSYIDRYLSMNPIDLKRLQLLGVSSVLIASKYEEIKPPKVHQLCYSMDKIYSKEEVVRMELDVLKSLEFEIGNPTVKTFLRKLTRVAHDKFKTVNLRFEFLGYYLAELSLLDYGCVELLPSLVAAAVIFLAKFTINPDDHPWDSALQQCSGYTPSDLEQCVLILHDLQLGRKGGELAVIRDKYKHHRFKCVATLLSPPDIPASYFKDADS